MATVSVCPINIEPASHARLQGSITLCPKRDEAGAGPLTWARPALPHQAVSSRRLAHYLAHLRRQGFTRFWTPLRLDPIDLEGAAPCLLVFVVV